MTKLEILFRSAKTMNDRKYGTQEMYEKAIYNLGRECFIKMLQGKLIEIKYDKTLINIGEEASLNE